MELFVDNLQRKVTSIVPEIIHNTSKIIYSSLKADLPRMLKERSYEERGFSKNLRNKWKSLLDQLIMYQVVCLEAGEVFNSENRKKYATENNFVFEVLTRLHSRACQVTQEIIVLLRFGFADGAIARWRTLHEISVVGCFIKDKGNIIAEKYILHDIVQSYKAACQFQQYVHRLNEQPFSTKEFTRLKTNYDNLIYKYGSNFTSEYGWASDELRIVRPSFRNIEENVSLDHIRPYYKWASYNVHANTKGIYNRLGLISGERNIFLAGPSNIGMIDPIQLSIMSLGHITKLL